MSERVPIDTSAVADRRVLRFGTIGDLRAEIERIAEADAAGRLRRTGN